MKIDELKSMYDQSFTELQELITNALSQVIQKEISIEKELIEESDLTGSVLGQEVPYVVITFSSGSGAGETKNLLVLQNDFVTRFYAWMINDEPAEEITDDHYDGLTESVQQVFGQLKMAVADDQASFQLNNLNIFMVNAPEDVQDYLVDEPGVGCVYYLSIEENVQQIVHYYWLLNLENASMEGNDMPAEQGGDTVDVMPAEFSPLTNGNGGMESDRNVEMLMDVKLELSVEIDRKMMLISDLLKLGKGSIVELEKSAGEPLDIFVNGRKFAEGEVVVVDDRFGIRITQLLSPKERVKSLG